MLEAFAELEVIVVAVYAEQTHLTNTVYHIIEFVIVLNQSCVCIKYVSVSSAGFTEVMPYGVCIGVMLYVSDTGIHIAVSAEVIISAIDFSPCTLVCRRTVAILCTCACYNPSTLNKDTVFIKGVNVFIDCCFACFKDIVGRRVAVTVICCLPTLLEYVVNRVVKVAVHLEDTGACFVYVTAVFVRTYKLTVYYFIVVGDNDLRNDCTPINHGLTSFTIGTVFVACLGKRSLFVHNRKLCIVSMVRRADSCKLGCNADRAAEAVNCFTVDVYNGFVAHICNVVIGTGYIVVTVEGPYANGDAYKNRFVGCYLGSVGYVYANRKNFGNFVVRELSFEAVSCNCTLGFPCVSVVELKAEYELFNLGNICNVNVYVVDGLCLGCFAGIVMSAERYSGITGNGEGSAKLCGVAKLVLDFEHNGVCTCGKDDVFCRRKGIACNGRLNCNTVNEDLTGGKVKSRIVCYRCGKCKITAGDNGAVFKRNSRIGSGVSRSRNCGKNSVIYSGAVIESNVINIERKLCRSSGLYVSTKERRRTEAAFICCNGSAKIIVTGNIYRHIYPTGFGNICLCCRVKVCLFACCSRGEHKVSLSMSISSVSVLCIEL